MFDTIRPVPRAALLLGAAGLLPTLAALAVVVFGDRPMQEWAFRAAGTYGACILSFLGGAWWGLAAARAHPRDLPIWLAIAVLPALGAWAAVWFLSSLSVGAMAAMFLACLWVDRELARRYVAPEWWLPLRLPLSLCMAALHLLLAVFARGKL